MERRFYRIELPCVPEPALSERSQLPPLLKKLTSTFTRSVVQHYNQVSMISQDLLDVLVCPVCRKPVVLNADGKGLRCGECRRVYPVQDDIPIMLVDAAKIDA
jgi:uncharacterized protein YbaR (Trm112 family)